MVLALLVLAVINHLVEFVDFLVHVVVIQALDAVVVQELVVRHVVVAAVMIVVVGQQ